MNHLIKIITVLGLALTMSACSYVYQEPEVNGQGGVATISTDTSFFSAQDTRIRFIDGKVASLFNPFSSMSSFRVSAGKHQLTILTDFKTTWYNRRLSEVTLNVNVKANHTYIVKTEVKGDTLLIWAVDQNGSPASTVIRDNASKARGVQPEDISYMNQIANIPVR